MKLTSDRRQVQVLVLVFALVLLLGYNFIKAYDEGVWSLPDGVPPTHNVAAPLNVGSSTQEKNGDLAVDQLVAFTDARAGKFCNLDGTVCATIDELLANKTGGGVPLTIFSNEHRLPNEDSVVPLMYNLRFQQDVQQDIDMASYSVAASWGGQIAESWGSEDFELRLRSSNHTFVPENAGYSSEVYVSADKTTMDRVCQDLGANSEAEVISFTSTAGVHSGAVILYFADDKWQYEFRRLDYVANRQPIGRPVVKLLSCS